jgi:drug/metabolite transporter (DMT)-like permease
MALNKSFSLNKVGIVTPVVFGGAIFLSTILSYFIFKEKITGIQGLGLAFLAIGFILIIYAKATAS